MPSERKRAKLVRDKFVCSQLPGLLFSDSIEPFGHDQISASPRWPLVNPARVTHAHEAFGKPAAHVLLPLSFTECLFALADKECVNECQSLSQRPVMAWRVENAKIESNDLLFDCDLPSAPNFG
jgi:hypothetical protein